MLTTPAQLSIEPEAGGYADYFRRIFPTVRTEHRRYGARGLELFHLQDRPLGHMMEIDAPEAALHMIARGLGGQGLLDLSDGRFPLPLVPGSFVVSPAAATCSYFAEESLDFITVCLPRTLLATAFPATGGMEMGALHSRCWRDPLVEQLVLRLWSEAAAGSPTGRLFADSAQVTLVVLLAGLARGAAGTIGGESTRNGGLAEWQLRRTTEYLADNLAEDVSLAELAEVARLSAHHFCRAFKRSTGVPPHQYQIALRIARAKALLLNTDLPVTDIAATVGYDDPNQLARIFRRATNTTPTRYRRDGRA